MNKFVRVKKSLLALFCSVFCCATGALGLNYFINNPLSIADATATGNNTFVLSNGESGISDASANDYRKLINAIGRAASGNATANYSYATMSSAIGSGAVKADKLSDYKIVFGGYTWNIAYVSKTRAPSVTTNAAGAAGDVVVTLYLADTGKRAGLDNDVVSQSSPHAVNATNVNYPSSMYATSLIRSSLVGSSYSATETATELTAGTQNPAWTRFTDNAQLGKYISTPAQIAYQETEYTSTYFNYFPNDAYGQKSNISGHSWFSDSTVNMADIQTKSGYGDWKTDKLWLPSLSETGWDSTRVGMWGLSATQRGNTNTASSDSSSAAGHTGQSWLRSGEYNYASRVYALGPTGSHYGNATNVSFAVRPALHLNLSLAMAAAEGNEPVDPADCEKTANEWNAAVQESLNNGGKQVTFKLPRNWIANPHETYKTSFGEGEDASTPFGSGRIQVPVGANIILDLNGHTIDRNLDEVLESFGSVIRVHGELTIEDSSAKKTGKITGGYTHNSGGGIYVADTESSPKLTINGGTITGNRVYAENREANGGGIFFSNGSFEMNGGSIEGNYTKTNGGGLYGTGNVQITINGGRIYGNTADNAGGGLFLVDSANSGNCSFTMNGGEISNNVANRAGAGGAFLSYNTINVINGGKINDNVLTNKIGAGGGIQMYASKLTMNGGEINGNNSATGAGGGLFVQHNAEFIMNGGEICRNTNTVDPTYMGGGGITSYGVVTINGGKINENSTTRNGGGILVRTSYDSNNKPVSIGKLTLNGGEICNNNAQWGGGIYINNGAQLYMNGGKVNNNTATGSAGGMFIWTDTTNMPHAVRNYFEMNGGEVSGNTSGTSGGVNLCSVDAVINDGRIYGNTASSGGGGVYISNVSQVTMNGGEISGNTSNTEGGGLVMDNAQFEMNGGVISGNSCTDLGAGVSFSEDGTFTMNGGVISDNKSISSGGGVHARGSFTLNGGEIINNIAGGYGGGVRAAGNLTINGGVITGNKAEQGGGGVHVHRNLIYISGGIIVNNTNGLSNADNFQLCMERNNDAAYAEEDIFHITGALGGANKVTLIGVNILYKQNVTLPFTKDYGKYNTANVRTYFFSDDPAYHIAYDSNKDAVLGAGPVAEKQVTWQYSTDNGATYTDIDGNYLKLPYTGATYKVRAWDKATNTAITNWVSNAGDVSAVGTYGYSVSVSSTPVLNNNVLQLDIVQTQLKWQYATSTDGSAWGEWKPFEENTIQYTGLYYKFRALGLDGQEVPLTADSSDSAKNAGEYSYSVEDPNNYYTNTGISFKINVRYISVSWEYQNAKGNASGYYWLYDGNAHAPVAVLGNLANNMVANTLLSFEYSRRGIAGTATAASANAGNWQVTVSLRAPDDNIVLTGTTALYIIRQLEASVSFADGDEHTFEYNTESHPVTGEVVGLIGADRGKVKPVISYYEGDTLLTGAPIKAGTYKAVATLPENSNYVLNGSYSAQIVINKKNVSVHWAGNAQNENAFEWTFDGTGKTPKATASNPYASGNFVLTVEYAPYISGVVGAWTTTVPVNAGTYAMRVSLQNADAQRNFRLLETQKEFVIGQREVTVGWVDGNGNAVTPNADGVVIWQYDGEGHTVQPSIFANGVTVDGTVGVQLDAERTDAQKDNLTTNASGTAIVANAKLTDNDFNKNFKITGSTSVKYQVIKRELSTASWVDKNDGVYDCSSVISYPYGSIVGAEGPGFKSVTAQGVNGSLTLESVSYDASFADETAWAVDTVNGYKATARLSAADWANYKFVGDNAENDGRTVFVKFYVRPASASRVEVDVVWANFAPENYPTSEVGEQVTGLTQRPYERFRDNLEGDGSTVTQATFTYTYSGKLLRPYAVRELFDDDGNYIGYELLATTTEQSVDAGNYILALLPANGNNNYAYSGRMECSYTIKPQDVKISWQKETAYYFNGGVQGPVATVCDSEGNALYTYGEENGNVFGLEVSLGRNAGLHTAKATVNGNYNITDGAKESYAINKLAIKADALSWSINNNEKWTAGENKPVTATFTYTNENNGYEYEIVFVITGAAETVGKHVATANLDSAIAEHDNFRIEGAATRSYEIVPVSTGTVYWVAERGGAYSSDPITYVYDGKVHTPSAYYYPAGADTSDPEQRVWLDDYIVTEAKPDAGKRLAKLEGDLDFTGAETVCEFEILPMPVLVEWDKASLSVDFDGAAHSPVAKRMYGANNVELVLGVDYTVTEYIWANTYTARLTFLNNNYTYATQDADGNPAGNTCQFTVNKADLSASAVWDFATAGANGDATNGWYWQYDAQNHAPVLKLDGIMLNGNGVAFTFKYSGVAASAGVHTVRAEIASAICDGQDVTSNYTLGGINTDYEIKPFEITVNWSFAGALGDATDGWYWHYDGKEHAPTASYTSWDGVKSLTVYGAARNASDAKYVARVTLPDNCVFASGETGTHEFEIKRANIIVEWRGDADGEFVYDTDDFGAQLSTGAWHWTYDGKEHAPVPYVADTNTRLEVTGLRVNAGTYTATAAQDNANYVIEKGGEVTFVIDPMQVYIKWYGDNDSETDFDYEYTGSAVERVPKAFLTDAAGEFILVDGNRVEVTVRGTASTMGTHKALAEDTFANYDFASDAVVEKEFKISAKDLADYSFEWRDASNTATVSRDDDDYIVYTYEFNGTAQAPVPFVTLPGNFNLIINMGTPAAPGGQISAITEVGEYFITASYADPNYKIPDGYAVIRVVITTRKVDVEWSKDTLVYNGTAQAPAAYYTDAFGNKVELKVTGAATDAGEKYKAVADFRAATGNYVLNSETVEKTFTIEKRTLGVSWAWGNEWTDGHATYDGLTHSPVPTVSGENIFAGDIGKLTVYFEISDKNGVLNDANGLVKTVKDAGAYKMTLKLGGDAMANYKFEDKKGEAEFTIDKKALTVTAQDVQVDYGSNAPDYQVAFDGFAAAEADAELARVLASKRSWLTCPYTNRTVPGPKPDGSDLANYTIGFVENRLSALLPNYSITFVTGTITVVPVKGTVVWSGELDDYGAEYDGAEYKPTAYYYDTNGSLVVLDVFYAKLNDNGSYTVDENASPAINAGIYYVVARAKNGNVTLSNAETSYQIHKREISVNIESKTSVYGDSARTLTWKYATDKRPLDGDDLGITLNCEVNDQNTFTGGFKDVGSYLIIGSWNTDNFGVNYEVIFSGEGEDSASGENIHGVYTVTNAKIVITKANETFSDEEFTSIQSLNGGDGWEILLAKVDENGKPIYIKYAGNQDANVHILYSRRHNIGQVGSLIDPPDPHDMSEEVNRYRESVDLIRDAGCYAINYVIEIPNHETLYGTWRVLMLPESRVVRITFVGDYISEYGTEVPEDLAILLLNRGLIELKNISASDFRRNATARVVNGADEVNGKTGVGSYTIEIELANNDDNVDRIVSYHNDFGDEDTNVNRFKITPKVIDIDWGNLNYEHDGEQHIPTPITTGWVTNESFTLPEIKVSASNDGIENTAYTLEDNGVSVTVIVKATGDFKTAGGHTLRVFIESPNYTIVENKDIGTVSVKGADTTKTQFQIPEWVWYVAIGAGVLLFILIIVIVVLSKRKGTVINGMDDDDGFYDDAT